MVESRLQFYSCGVDSIHFITATLAVSQKHLCGTVRPPQHRILPQCDAGLTDHLWAQVFSWQFEGGLQESQLLRETLILSCPGQHERTDLLQLQRNKKDKRQRQKWGFHPWIYALPSSVCVVVCVWERDTERDSYRHHSMLPVMFVIRQHFSDLGQLVLQLSVRVDLDRQEMMLSVSLYYTFFTILHVL